MAAARGDVDRAIELFRGAATALEETGASARQAGTAWRELGEAYLELGRQQEAIEALRRASDLAGATYNPIAPCVRGGGTAVHRPLTTGEVVGSGRATSAGTRLGCPGR